MHQALAATRLPADVVLSVAIKSTSILMPLCLRLLPGGLDNTSGRALLWGLSGGEQLAVAVAVGLPLAAALLASSSYHNARDGLLAAGQAVLVLLVRPAACFRVAAKLQLAASCLAGLLLLLYRQRLLWAAWQAGFNLAASLSALAGMGVGRRRCDMAVMLLHAVLPLALLPVVYVREQADR